MFVFQSFLVVGFLSVIVSSQKTGISDQDGVKKTVCYYNSKSFHRLGQGHMPPSDLKYAAPYCTHLIYGFATVDKDNHKVKPSDVDLDVKRDNYLTITDLKIHNPRLKVLLSIGGYENEDPKTYMEALEDTASHNLLVESAIQLLYHYGFDGLDLAWQFPKIKVVKNSTIFKRAWLKIKDIFGHGEYNDQKVDKHRDQFTNLIQHFSDKLAGNLLTLTQLPNVNASAYIDVQAINSYVDQVHLMSFDFIKSTRDKYVADFSNPIYPLKNRLLTDRSYSNNINNDVKYWLNGNMPKDEIIVILPTYGNAWKIRNPKKVTGEPPVAAEGPSDETPLTKTTGLLAYYEICNQLINASPYIKTFEYMKRTPPLNRHRGIFAYRSPKDDKHAGLWVTYEDPGSVVDKKKYVLFKGLGGIGLSDLSMDDFRGSCDSGLKFPLLKAANKENVLQRETNFVKSKYFGLSFNTLI